MAGMDITLILFLVALNGLFALSEMAIVASRHARLQQLGDERHGGAVAALALHKDPSRFLSTVQVGITAVGVLSGAVGESLIADDRGMGCGQYTWLAPVRRASDSSSPSR
jgi:putative hemolysin